MITVHHLNNSRSQRILWLLEELNLPYEVKRYERDLKTMRGPASLKSVHALGKSPVITDDRATDIEATDDSEVADGQVTVAESGAIIEYLVSTYGAERLGFESGSSAHRELIYWLHFSEGSLMPPMLMRLLFDKIQSSPMPFFVKPVANMICSKVTKTFIGPEIVSVLGFIDNHLAEREWFAGDKLSGADIQMSFPLEASVARDLINANSYPNIYAYVKRLQALPAYLAALEKGGDYDYGPRS